MFLSYITAALLAVTASAAQNSTAIVEPCASVSSLLAAGATVVPAQVAEECLTSAPLVKGDALAIVDGFIGMLEWQSDTAWLKNPPSDYQLPAADLAGMLTELRQQITSGNLTSEIAFERGITAVLAKAQDGHLNYELDGMNVFEFTTGFGSINVVSLDGKQAPGVYVYEDLVKYAGGSMDAPSAVTTFNGINITQFILGEIHNNVYVGLQDLDAAFNSYMSGPVNFNLPNGGPTIGKFNAVFGTHRGANTTLGFANGTTLTHPNFAATIRNFTGVDDGPSFSLNFCNATQKALLAEQSLGGANNTATDSLASRVVRNRRLRRAAAIPVASTVSQTTSMPVTATATATNTQSAAATATRLVGYPVPEIISADGAISGYFLNTSKPRDLAVIVMTQFPENSPDFQSVLFKFLADCRAANSTYLVIDITGNPGGTVGLAYDSFKQFFPSVTPYGASNLRAQEALNIIGQQTTDVATKQGQSSSNITAFQNLGGDSNFDAKTTLDDKGVLFESWKALYGPVTAHGDQFTNLFRYDIANSSFDQGFAGITISGYGGQPVGPQPFKSENIIIVGDGSCSSTCSIFSHFMKWQGKVKSIAVGGRPMPGPMQSIGGIKGSEVAEVVDFMQEVETDLTDEQYAALNKTASAPFFNNVELMLLRTQSEGSAPGDLSFNLKNNIAEGYSSLTPLQYIYEAADCRLYNTPQFIVDISQKWLVAAQQAFGINSTAVFSGCVPGSTNQPSSLSGNKALFNNGVPNNVTDFFTKVGNSTGL